MADDKMAADLEASLLSVREPPPSSNARRRIRASARSWSATESALASLQATTRNLATSLPKITDNVTATTDAMPAPLLQAQIAAHELELLLGQLRHNWLFGGGRRAARAGEPPRAGHRGAAVTPRLGVLAPFAALALAACGGGSPVDTGPPTDVGSTRPTVPARRRCRSTCRASRCASTR